MGFMSKLKKSKPEEVDADIDASGAEETPKKKAKVVAAGGGPKQFLIDHAEKIGLGAVALCLLLMIWSAFGRERLPDNRSPDDLLAKVNSQENQIQNSETPKVTASANRFPALIAEQLKPIDSGMIDTNVKLWSDDLIVTPQLATKREDPLVFPPEDALAIAGVGLIVTTKEKDLLGDGYAERLKIAQQKAAEEKELEAKEAARLLREKRAKDKAERDKKRTKTTRDKKKEQEEEERRARISATRVPDSPVRPLPDDLMSGGFQPPAEVRGGQVFIASPRRWVSVLALAPRYKQQQEYNEKFLNTVGYNPERDRPSYLGVRIARLEILENAGDKPLDWSQAKEWTFKEQNEAMAAQKSTWVGEAQPVISDAFYAEKLNQPLGPLLLQGWEKWAAHPKVILLGEALAAEQVPLEVVEEPIEEEAEPSVDDPFGLKTAPKTEEEKLPRGTTRPDQRIPVRGARPPGLRPRGEQFGGRERDRMNLEMSEQGKFLQIRVFDFGVEPGKRYRYRVQVALLNPNSSYYGAEAVPPAFLANPQSRDTLYKTTEWSEPTNLVVVPTGQQSFAGTVNLPDEDDDFQESYGTVLSRVINFGKGTITSAMFDVYRGGMVSGITEGFEVDPIEKTITRTEDSLIETDLLLLDLRGGPLNKSDDAEAALLGRPAEMLFLDSKGNLIVRSELDDAEAMHEYRRIAGIQDNVDPGPNPVNPFPQEGVGPEGPGPPEGFNIFEQEGKRR